MTPVWVFGVPRSGTSWLGELLNSAPEVAYRFQPLFSYAFKDAIQPGDSAASMRRVHADIAATQDPFVLHGPSLAPPHPFRKVQATHLVLKEARYLHLVQPLLARLPEVRIVAIVRSPQAVLASWKAAPKEYDPSWDFDVEWRAAPSKNAGRPENFYGFDAWLHTTNQLVALADAMPERVTLVSYGDLVADTLSELERLFRWCGLSMGSQTRDFAQASRSRDDGNPYGVFREARSHDLHWVGTLPSSIVDEIERLTRSTAAARFLPTLVT